MKILQVFLLLVIAIVAKSHPTSGSYCGSYWGIISGKMTVQGDNMILALDIGGTKTTCPATPFSVKPDGRVDVPAFTDKKTCLGHLLSEGNIQLSAKYDAAADKIILDAGVGKVDLTRC